MSKRYFPVREMAQILHFEIVGKLTRVSDSWYGFNGHSPIYIDDAGNEYIPGLIGDVSCGCIVTADGAVI